MSSDASLPPEHFAKHAPIDARDDAAYVARLVAKMGTVRSETLAELGRQDYRAAFLLACAELIEAEDATSAGYIRAKPFKPSRAVKKFAEAL